MTSFEKTTSITTDNSKGGQRGMTEDNCRLSTNSLEADYNFNSATLDNDPTIELAWVSETGDTKTFNYDDLARNLDANLAEIDMEDFGSEDIPSLLALPAAVLCGGEQFASVSGSLLLKLGALDSPLTPQSGSQSDVSMGKSDVLLFSPVREGPLLPSFSVDSLDCESYDEHELLLTCRANKHNYTIAFEGSFARASDDSDYHDEGGSDFGDSTCWPSARLRLRPPSSVDASMVQSDFAYTTWSKLKNGSEVSRRKGTGISGLPTPNARAAAAVAAAGGATKSLSLPDLLRRSVSNADELRLSRLNVSADSDRGGVPLFDMQASRDSSNSSSQQSFSLVRLFFQHKGSSQDTSVSVMDGSTDSMAYAPTNRPDPNICVDSSCDKMGSGSSSPNRLDLNKDGIVLHHKNLMCGTKKGTNQSGLVSPTPTCLQDSLAGEDEDEDVEMMSIDEQTGDLGIEHIRNLFPSGWAIHRIASSPPPQQSQGTQTKRLNSSEQSPTEASEVHNEVLNNERKPSEPSSHSRLHRTSPGFINNTQGEGIVRLKSNVSIATMRSLGTQVPVHVVDRGIQTSLIAERQAISTTLQESKKSETSNKQDDEVVAQAAEENGQSRTRSAVYVCYPNYSLPDLSFLRSPLASSLTSARMFLVPQTLEDQTSPGPTVTRREPRPRSCPEVESLKRRGGLDHIKDWDSLSLLLPRQVRHLLGERSDKPDPATDIPHFCRERRRHRLSPNAPPPPLRSMSLPTGQPCNESHMSLPPASPLPRGILRKTSPSRAEPTSSQRFSLCDVPPHQKEEKSLKRHSLQGAWEYVSPEPQPCNSAIVLSNRNAPPTAPCTPPPASAAFNSRPSLGSSSSMDSGTPCCEHPGCCMCDRSRNKKSVSFSENICIRKSFIPESGNTPESSPDLSDKQHLTNKGTAAAGLAANLPGNAVQCTQRPSSIFDDVDAETPPHEFCISPPRSSSPTSSLCNVQQAEKSCDALVDMNHKRALVSSVSAAVQVLVNHFGQTKDPQQKYQLGSSSLTPVCGHKVLNWLCPAILELVSDGLHPSIYSFFGQIHNSAWRVVEASAQLVGPSTRALNDLVVRLNSEDSLRESVHKFNAFVFGLLNIRSLDSWLAFLRSQESLLQKHYQPHAFLFLSNSLMQPLYNELLVALQPLSLMPFELDLLLEVNRAPCHDDKNVKDFQNQQARQATKPELDEAKWATRKEQRPRSCAETSPGSGFSLTDIASHVKRRWSGIQIGSKLLQALDKMVLDPQWAGAGEERSDDATPWPQKEAKPSTDVTPEDQPVFQDRPKPDGASEMASINSYPKNNDTSPTFITPRDNEEKAATEADEQNGTEQFRLLQKKWEQLSARPERKIAGGVTSNVVGNLTTNAALAPLSTPVSTPVPTPVSTPVTNRSRIPRLVATPRPGKIDDSVMSLRSSASGQSVHGQDVAKDRISNKDEKDAENDAVGKGASLAGAKSLNDIAAVSPKKRPAPLRTNSVPSSGKSHHAKSTGAIRRMVSPPRAKSSLPRKLAGRSHDSADNESSVL